MISKSQLKYIQSLGQKKHRDMEPVFVAEGPKLINELLHEPSVHVEQLYATEEWINGNNQLAQQTGTLEISQQELERISQLKTPNRVLALIKKFEVKEPVIKNKLSLVLDTIQDPGNLGTIIRTADWFGIDQLICSNDCADLYNPKVVQATMGSIARVNVFYTDLSTWLAIQKNITIFGCVLTGENVFNIQPVTEGLIVIGNESKGISEEVLQFVNQKITIGKKGKAESLNAAVAAGVVLACLNRDLGGLKGL